MNNPGRKATPDSEAVGSSEDERPWPSSTSFGQLPMRDSSMPGLPGGIWTQKRGSFKMSDAAKRNALHEVRLGAGGGTPGLLSGNTPSPGGDRAGSLPFSIPLQPVAKTGRSLSHSQGQREFPSSTGAHTMPTASSVAHNPALPLGLLAEEADTDSEPDMGSRLTHTTSHPPIGTLMRTTTLPTAFEGFHGLAGSRNPADPSSPQAGSNVDRRLEASFAGLTFDSQPRRTQWQSSLGWDDVRVNESRRHSMADIPTRRGSLVGGEAGLLGRTFSNEVFESDDAHRNRTAGTNYPGFATEGHASAANDKIGAQHPQNGSFGYEIPANYRAPHVNLNEREQDETSHVQEQHAPGAMQHWPPQGGSRPRKQLYIVSFKCSRVDVFYLLENTGLTVREGNLVIVEADRGQDLGTVQHANVTPEAARLYKKKYAEEQYKWLMMYSQNKEGASNPNAELQRENTDRPYYGDAGANLQSHPGFARDSIATLKPKAIKRLAQEHEIKMLTEKEGNEAKAKRTCQQKVAHLRLQMEILDAEWQWDFQKLIFYYYADHYINFKDLITELYRIYKTRIWLSAINPASFSQHAINQPPAGIGPGALAPGSPFGLNNSYTMAYGEDRDPYGAQMPYRIGYDTYTPNFPSIPGVPNSFAPGTNPPYMMGFYPGTMGGGHPSMTQQALDNNGSMHHSAALAQRAPAEWNMLYNTAGLTHDPRSLEASMMAHAAHSSDGARPNYSFGPRTPGGNVRVNPWDGANRGTYRNPGLPNPIGTRPGAHGEDLSRVSTAPTASGNTKNAQRYADQPSKLAGNRTDEKS